MLGRIQENTQKTCHTVLSFDFKISVNGHNGAVTEAKVSGTETRAGNLFRLWILIFTVKLTRDVPS